MVHTRNGTFDSYIFALGGEPLRSTICSCLNIPKWPFRGRNICYERLASILVYLLRSFTFSPMGLAHQRNSCYELGSVLVLLDRSVSLSLLRLARRFDCQQSHSLTRGLNWNWSCCSNSGGLDWNWSCYSSLELCSDFCCDESDS